MAVRQHQLFACIYGDDSLQKMNGKKFPEINDVTECDGYLLTSGHQGRPGHTPYTRVDHGTCGGLPSLELPGPLGHCPPLDASEKTSKARRVFKCIPYWKTMQTNKMLWSLGLPCTSHVFKNSYSLQGLQVNLKM